MKRNTLFVFQIWCAAALMVVGIFLAGHHSQQVVQAEVHVPMQEESKAPASNENKYVQASRRAAFVAATTSAATASLIYVKDDASGANDATSWTNAYPDRQEGLAADTALLELLKAQTGTAVLAGATAERYEGQVVANLANLS